MQDDLEQRRDRAVGGDVSAEAAHFSVGLAKQRAGVRHFLFADGADGIEQAVEDRGGERVVLPCHRGLGERVEARP